MTMGRFGDTEQLEKTAARVVDMALARGAETAVVAFSQRAAFEATVRNGETESLSEADSQSLSLNLSREGRRASVSSCDVRENGLSELVDMALSLCRYTDPDPYYSLPQADLLARNDDDLQLFDESLPALKPSQKIDFARELEATLVALDPQLSSEGATFATVLSGSALANSLGFCRSENTTLIEANLSAFIEDRVAGDLNQGRKQTGGWLSRARYLADLEDKEFRAAQTIERVRRKLGARRPPTGKVPVYFEPKFARTLWLHLIAGLTGSAVYRRETYLADRLGTAVCAPAVTMRDDPLIPRGLGSRLFDDEGVACQRQDILVDGVLQTWLMGTYSANKLGLRSTGHAGGPCNLIIEPGPFSEQDMLARMDRGVWVTSLLGQGVNISTGDYSRGAQGLWIENGRISHPVAEFTLNSHLDQMFRGIVMLGNNQYAASSIRTPGLVIEEMTISGV